MTLLHLGPGCANGEYQSRCAPILTWRAELSMGHSEARYAAFHMQGLRTSIMPGERAAQS